MGNFLRRALGGQSQTDTNNSKGSSASSIAARRQSSGVQRSRSRSRSAMIRASSSSIDRLPSNMKYAYIPDNFTNLDQVTAALKEAGLESSNLIVGIDFTKSNEWSGQRSFGNRSLHAIDNGPNPYEQAISIIGKTLAPFDDDNLIPCFGFGDANTHDQEVFSFHRDHSPCHGFEEVLTCYKQIAQNVRLSGPTSFGPIVDAAVDIVEKHGGQYHVLLIIADGQVTRSINPNEQSPQEVRTTQSIVTASSYPLSIVLVGVGDGPWDDMKKFDDRLPAREFDNFQFVNFTDIMSRNASQSSKEAAFALAALMEIPIQYKACREHGVIGRVTGTAKKVVPRLPPAPYQRESFQPSLHQPQSLRQPSRQSSHLSDSDSIDREQACPICFSNPKDLAFGCGHLTCRVCGMNLSDCPICRLPIRSRLRLYIG
ncbi:hypothetical protein Sjap_003677 [Stephania japonica]|uniref:RING-type domain-containing protein n=1 Tax=Stephania japonica TaxID=461633 RepID=A0AAP0KRA9_9MAGN